MLKSISRLILSLLVILIHSPSRAFCTDDLPSTLPNPDLIPLRSIIALKHHRGPAVLNPPAPRSIMLLDTGEFINQDSELLAIISPDQALALQQALIACTSTELIDRDLGQPPLVGASSDQYWIQNTEGVSWVAAHVSSGHHFELLLCPEISRRTVSILDGIDEIFYPKP